MTPEVGPPTQMAVFTVGTDQETSTAATAPGHEGGEGRMTTTPPLETAAARTPRRLPVTDLSLVVLVGATGSGKSTFAAKHFKPTEVLSSDFCRGLVADDENDQSASRDAFDVLHHIAGKRLAAGG